MLMNQESSLILQPRDMIIISEWKQQPYFSAPCVQMIPVFHTVLDYGILDCPICYKPVL